MTDPAHIADAYQYIAKVDHYLVRVDNAAFSLDELLEAEQLLITRQNALAPHQKTAHKRLDLALDMVEHDKGLPHYR